MDVAVLLAAYDEFRDQLPDPGECERAERDGPLVRMAGWRRGGFVQYRDLGGIEGAALDELIARQVAFFRERGESFEWKTHGHDLPADLPDRLRAAGFAMEPEETVLLAPSSAIMKEAAGVVGAIVPWNYPFEVSSRRSVRRSPPATRDPEARARHAVERDPHRSARRRADRHPAGVFNVVTSSDHLVGEELVIEPARRPHLVHRFDRHRQPHLREGRAPR